MIAGTPAALPEPAASVPPASRRVETPDDRSTPDFHALLDEQADLQREPGGLETGDEASAESASVDTQSVDPEETESDGAIEEAETDSEPRTADATVLSSQLAMWQILPQSVVPAGSNADKIAAPVAAEDGIVAADFGSNGSAENISASNLTGPPMDVKTGTESTRNSRNERAPSGPFESASGQPLQKPLPSTPGGVVAVPADGTALPANPLGDRVSREVAEDLPKVHAQANGIPVAKQQRAMSNPEFHPTEAPETAVLAGSNTAGTSAAAIVPATAAGGQKFQEQSREEAGRQPDTLLAGTAMVAPEVKSHHSATTGAFPTTAHAVEATKVIEQIERATERMRSQDGQRIEMRLPTQDGGELLVRLQISGGELKAVFRTESTGLRDALQAGWTQYTAATAERELKVGQAVFESPSMQSEMGSHSQTPDQRGREHAFAEAESSGNSSAPFPSAGKSVRTTHSTPVTTPNSAGLQIYA